MTSLALLLTYAVSLWFSTASHHRLTRPGKLYILVPVFNFFLYRGCSYPLILLQHFTARYSMCIMSMLGKLTTNVRPWSRREVVVQAASKFKFWARDNHDHVRDRSRYT